MEPLPVRYFDDFIPKIALIVLCTFSLPPLNTLHAPGYTKFAVIESPRVVTFKAQSTSSRTAKDDFLYSTIVK